MRTKTDILNMVNNIEWSSTNLVSYKCKIMNRRKSCFFLLFFLFVGKRFCMTTSKEIIIIEHWVEGSYIIETDVSSIYSHRGWHTKSLIKPTNKTKCFLCNSATKIYGIVLTHTPHIFYIMAVFITIQCKTCMFWRRRLKGIMSHTYTNTKWDVHLLRFHFIFIC